MERAKLRPSKVSPRSPPPSSCASGLARRWASRRALRWTVLLGLLSWPQREYRYRLDVDMDSDIEIDIDCYIYRYSHKHLDPTLWFESPTQMGIPETMACRIVLFTWSLGRLYCKSFSNHDAIARLKIRDSRFGN